MPLAWTDQLATGNRPIDHQHKQLFQLCNDLHAAMSRREGERAVGRTLSALAVYVVAHFRMEETLMLKSGYDGLEAHREAHQIMTNQVERMIDHYNSTGLDPTQVLRLLEEWLIVHVQDDDKTMAQFLMSCPQGAWVD
jgi:hemerythrin